MYEVALSQGETRNRILASLPEEEFLALTPALRPHILTAGVTLLNAEEKIEYVYFVEKGLISLLSVLEEGTSIEVGVAGREGACDIGVLLGSDAASHQALVQMDGLALRMKTEDAREAFRRYEQFRQTLLRYTRMLLALTSQTAACNAVHTIEERLARWLLISEPRVGSELLPLTHEFLSQMLGVRRSGVTVAAGALQRAGLIRYTRKDIYILDREGLEYASCECFQSMNAELERYLNE